MSRYYLDTNILVFLMTDDKDELSDEVKGIMEDYSMMLYTSPICVMELIHLFQIGKLGKHGERGLTNPGVVVEWLHGNGIAIRPIEDKHLETLASLPMREDHRDPEDRMIIAQSISDRIPIISSDRKFRFYEKDGLKLIFNRR